MAETGLLTVVEAADILRLRPSTVRAWILHRKIAHVKLGGRVFLRKGDCEALIAASLVPARLEDGPRLKPVSREGMR
jgi:excisionase family DNA binding protein